MCHERRLSPFPYDRFPRDPGGAVAAITEADIRELAGFKGSEAPVTSCYLNVDGRRFVRHRDYEQAFERLVRSARRKANGDQSVARDLQRIEEYVRKGFDRSHVRGIAIFSCSKQDMWRVFELPVPVRNQLVVNHSPSVRQLEFVIDEYEPLGVLLADKQRARMLVFELGELVESEEIFEQLPRHDDDDQSVLRDRVQSHVAAHAHQHFRHVADRAFRVYQERPFAHLIVAAPEEVTGEIERLLHPYLQERLAGRLSIPVSASLEEIRHAALEEEARVERRQEARAVARLRDAVGSGRRGVAGLDGTLRALVERRVDTLLVSEGYGEAGWRCGGCGYIGRMGRACPVCAQKMDKVDDVVEEAVEEALHQSCRVMICTGSADLDVLGRIGALLRF